MRTLSKLFWSFRPSNVTNYISLLKQLYKNFLQVIRGKIPKLPGTVVPTKKKTFHWLKVILNHFRPMECHIFFREHVHYIYIERDIIDMYRDIIERVYLYNTLF